MAHVTHKKEFQVPGYKLSRQNESGDSKVASAASRAIASGKCIYYDRRTGELFVLCDGRAVRWESADATKIGKEILSE